MPERLNGPHSKCGILARVSGVQIPLSPPTKNLMNKQLLKRLSLRLKIAWFILSVLGCLLPIFIVLEMLGFNFLGVENFIKQPIFNWSLKILIILLFILLLKKKNDIALFLEKHSWFKIVIKAIFLFGTVGLFFSLISMII